MACDVFDILDEAVEHLGDRYPREGTMARRRVERTKMPPAPGPRCLHSVTWHVVQWMLSCTSLWRGAVVVQNAS